MTAKRTTQSVTVTVDRELVNRARDAGLNMSATLTVALNAELKKHAATRWREENAEAIAALNQLADETGCFSDEYRSFLAMQFTVYRSRGRNAAFPFVIDVTSDIIGEINRRIVIPLTPIERFSRIRPPERLNPILLLVDGKEYVLMTHETATVPVNALGTKFCDASAHRTLIKGALDFMLDGI